MSDKKNLCMLPWVHLHTWPNGTVYPCCVTPMNYKAGNLNDNTLEEVYNSDLMKEIRVKMINEERHDACSRCWLQEDQGGMSMRHRANKSWTEYEYMIDDTKEDGTVEEMKLPYWDFRFSNICNFKCRSCGPQLSTGWYTDVKKISVIETGKPTLPDDIPKGNKFDLWEQIEPHFESVEEIYFAGGEPLIMEEHYKILKALVDIGKAKEVRLIYNTNFTKLSYKKLNVLDLWPEFEDVSVGASLDAMGPRAELIRNGTVWKDIEKNREDMLKKCPQVDFYVSATLSAFTAYTIINDLKKIDNQIIILSGGGTKNKFILNLIKENFGNRVFLIDEIYGDAKFIESQAFAYLGIRRVKNLPISFPGTTGVKNPLTGGKITKLSIF